MNFQAFQLYALIASCAFVVGPQTMCYAGEPAYQKPARSYCYMGCESCPSCYRGHCRHHKKKLVPPPFLPVIQSQAIRTRPPESDALRMRLQVKPQPEEEEKPAEAERFRDRDRRDRPYQKLDAPSQKASHLTETGDAAELNERFNRLERQVQLLMQKLDDVLTQQQERTARALRVTTED